MSDAIHAILQDLTAAQGALRRSSTAFDGAIGHLGDVLAAIARANQAQGEAIDAVITATNKALQLYTPGERH